MRPLWFDILLLAMPLAVAAMGLGGSMQLRRIRPAMRATVLIGAILLIGGLVAIGQVFPAIGAPIVAQLGGITILLCLLTIFLLGAAWSEPSRRATAPFLLALMALAGFVIAVHASGPLFWRTTGAAAWSRFPDGAGGLVQSHGFSCAPAAGSMLLAMHGHVVSEGHLAYLARTSVFGTDAEMLARATGRLLATELRAEVVRDWEALEVESLLPFVAYIGGRFAGHAILVRPLVDGTFLVIDPADGRRTIKSEERIREIWDRIAVRIVPVG